MITGGNVKRVSAERKNEKFETKGLAMNIGILDVKRKGKTLIIRYAHTATYEPDEATLTIEGEIFYEDDEKKLREAEDAWNKTKTLQKDIAEQVLNATTVTATAVGTLLAFAISVPAPIVTQKYSIGDKPQQDAGRQAG